MPHTLSDSLERGTICFVAVETNDKLDNLPKGLRAEISQEYNWEVLSHLSAHSNDLMLGPLWETHTGEGGPMLDKFSGGITPSPRNGGGWVSIVWKNPRP